MKRVWIHALLMVCMAVSSTAVTRVAIGQATPSDSQPQTPSSGSVLMPQAVAPAAQAAVPPMPPPVPLKPTGQLPVPLAISTVPDVTRYLNNPSLLVFCTSQVSSFNDRNAEVIFIGDSITQGWMSKGRAVWDANFAPLNALDFGISGDQTQHVLWRMDNYPIAHLRPRVAVILIGTNNQSNTPAEIADGVKAVVEKTRGMFPGIHIVLNSIMPNSRDNERMMAANALLRPMANGRDIVYLDLVAIMTPVGDNWKGLGPDHLHPDQSGYQLWADALLPVLKGLLKDTSDTPAHVRIQ